MTDAASHDLNARLPVDDPDFWVLDPEVTFLNHGSFGSCPRPVLDFQQQLRARLERQPVLFLAREFEALWDAARAELAQFLGAKPECLVFVPSATAGVNTVLRSLRFEPGDELLVTNHEYNACRNALNAAAERDRARVIVADVPFPLCNAGEIVDAVVRGVTSRTRLALLDHVTSQTGLVMPIQELVTELLTRGVPTLVDGAHAPGMVPVRMDQLGAAFYTGNCHKWMCSPKGAGFLHVRSDLQAQVRPLSISHGANSPRTDRSRFLIEFGWTGSFDPTPWLSVPESIRIMSALMPGGWPELMSRNHALAVSARAELCRALGIMAPCPDDLIGSMASLPIPDAPSLEARRSPLYSDPLQDRLWAAYKIEVPVIPWPATPRRLLRISAQAYNTRSQYKLLAEALRKELQ